MEPAGPCASCPAGAAQPARYTCPRCNAPYCSLRCYRAHGACAEDFYRDQVLGELRGRSASPSRLARALRRLRQQRETEDEPDAAGPGGGRPRRGTGAALGGPRAAGPEDPHRGAAWLNGDRSLIKL
ncbi:zinc finger HIT domain-containing protein 2 [Carlito syrichta]|uniref:Zinc finger HIT domain-containing protein 2 n=1 Tax=Carlito syrichta TaxID=1868482 RepID=A0A3Q0DZG7_CARSF|nr:zinc finger HIT domain-containing protein 2 [Carlito syrichta]